MLWSRGFFRLWLVLSTVWLIIWGIAVYQNFPSRSTETWYLNPDSSVQHGNVFDNDALKALETGTEKKIDGFSMIVPKEGSPAYVAYFARVPPPPKGFVLDPPEKNLAWLAERDYQQRMTNNVWEPLEIGLGVPVVVFLLGAAFIWAFRGFRTDAREHPS